MLNFVNSPSSRIMYSRYFATVKMNVNNQYAQPDVINELLGSDQIVNKFILPYV